MPEEKASGEIGGFICELAAKYGTPPFSPHITLMGGIETSNESSLVELSRMLCRRPPPLLQLLGFDCGNHPRKPFYIQVAKTLNLENMWSMTHEVLGVNRSDMPAPHLSLIYGTFTTEQKQEMRTICRILLLTSSIRCDRIQLWRTPQEVKDWRKLGTFYFRN
jgi:hypothetical protein